MYYWSVQELVKPLERCVKFLPEGTEKEEIIKELRRCTGKIDNELDEAKTKARYWEEKYRREKNGTKEILENFAEAIQLEFYKEFEEIIPSIMEEKIEALVKEMAGD